MKKLFLIILCIFIAILFISCGGNGDGDNDGGNSISKPIIQSFTVSLDAIYVGGTVTLSWNVSGADTISIDNGIGNVSSSGTETVTLDTKGTVNFTLTATNSGGTSTAQATVRVLEVSWTKIYGGVSDDHSSSVQQTSDGGYIIGGWSKSYGAGGQDIYLVKTDSSGNQLWAKTFGGLNDEWGGPIQQTSDGGYILSGDTLSYGAGGKDIYLIKTDSSGNQLWEQTFGGANNDAGWSVRQTSDNGYIIAGYTMSYGSGEWDIYLVKTDSSGNQLWAKTFGGASMDVSYSVRQTSDGGYIIVGGTYSYGEGDCDIYLIKTDSSGNQLWAKTFGGVDYDCGLSIQQTSDSGYIIAGLTDSFSGGDFDFYLIKTDSSGNKVMERTFGGTDSDYGYTVQQTSDYGYVIVGSTRSYGEGLLDVYIVKTDSYGDIIWEQTFGGTESDEGRSVQQTTDGGYIIVGISKSFGPGEEDFYLIKID